MSTAPSTCPPAPARAAVFIGGPVYRDHRYGANHPLSIPRVSLTFDLIQSYRALSPEEFLPGRPAGDDELAQFHTGEYIGALRAVEKAGRVSPAARERHRLGTLENPWFPGLYSVPAFATGSSLLGAEQVLAGRTAFSPAGGMHHARRDRAEGFCYLNDPVLAILKFRQAQRRVLYVDIDAHHGDAVEAAFANDPNVFTFSLHMDTHYAYPYRGGTTRDCGAPGGEQTCLNVPLPLYTHDAEYRLLFEALWPVVHRGFAPDVVALQAGTDLVHGDPLGRLHISTACFLDVVARVAADSPRLLVVGGGGYHPLLLARCWVGVWAILSGRELPRAIPPEGQALLRSVEWDLGDDPDETLYLERFEAGEVGTVRSEIHALLDELRRTHSWLKRL